MSKNNRKILNIFDVIIITFASSFAIRWIAVAACIGPSSIFLWLFGAVLFFLPLALMTAQMSRAYPEEGGLYAWTRRALGEGHGFMVSWIYWVNNIFCFPAILIFVASNLAYAIGRPELVHDTTFVLTTALIGFWAILLISLFGLNVSKYFINLGSFFWLFLPYIIINHFCYCSLPIFWW